MRNAVFVSVFFLSLIPRIATADSDLSKDVVINIVQNTPCGLRLPLGTIHIRPYTDTVLAKTLNDLRDVGVITYEGANKSSGNVWQDLSNNLGKEVGEGDLEVRLAPGVGEEHLVTLGNIKCLKGYTATDVKILNWNYDIIKTKSLATIRVLLAEGTFKRGNYDSLYLSYLQKSQFGPIFDGKFRALYAYDQFQDRWMFKAINYAALTEPNWRLNNVERQLEAIQNQ